MYSRRSVLTGFLLAPLLAACGLSPAKDRQDDLLAWPAQDRWPPIFYQASTDALEAYRYAVTHPEILQYFPCYCGCVEWGHRSVLDCSVQEVRPDGSVVLDSMTFG